MTLKPLPPDVLFAWEQWQIAAAVGGNGCFTCQVLGLLINARGITA